MNDIKLVLTSVDKQEIAQRIATSLVEQKLAACVQISAAGSSVYTWEGVLCVEDEHYLSIKTNDKHLKAVITWLETHHHYDTPEIIILNAKASRVYHDWLSNSIDN